MPARRCGDCPADDGSSKKKSNITRALAGCKNPPRLCTAASREKHEEFMRSTKESIAGMPVSILPGVSCADARRLCKSGFRTVDTLTEKLAEMGHDKLCFVNWLVCAASMRRKDALLCYCALLNFHKLNDASGEEEEPEEDDRDTENEREQEQTTSGRQKSRARPNGVNRTAEKPGRPPMQQASQWNRRPTASTSNGGQGLRWTCQCYISQNNGGDISQNNGGDDGRDQTWDHDQTEEEERGPGTQQSRKRHMSAMDALEDITRTISRVKMPRGKANGANTKEK